MKPFQETKHSAAALKKIFENYLFKEAFNGFPNVLLEPAMQIMRMKAKRIRPVLLLTACEAFGGDISNAMDIAAAVEIYHNFTLVHDDIIDHADIRRNEVTVHKKFGINKAILTGDAMLVHAQCLISHAAPEKHFDLAQTFQHAAMEVIKGEQIDVDFEGLTEVTVPEYLEMIRLKTSVLLAASLKLGAIVGGASAEDMKEIYDFGLNLGVAFQIKDDYLDSFGNQKIFGKKIGGDILQNKKTFLLCLALKNADMEERKEIFRIFKESNENEKIEAMLKMFEKIGVHDDTFAEMETFFDKSMASLHAISLTEENKTRLLQLARNIYHRSF